ncbi:MAG TPA: dihydrolipoyl dehydrogenase [Spirochaetaceae bacterium]|nr:dihydrolipoyl dehydrogenase [Spirochaetaceae bacterium]
MHDVVIIGGGPAGYRAAERLGERGRSVLLVEKGHLGGTCLNVGCVPTKTLLNSAKLYAHALESERFGVSADSVRFDWERMMAWKQEVVEKLRAGIAGEMKKAKVTLIAGEAAIEGPGKVRVNEAGAPSCIEECKAILIATGSSPFAPPIPGLKGNPKVLDSTGILELKDFPKRLCVIGGGVIGVEFASLFSSLGCEVSVVEMMDEIVPFMDAEQAPVLRRALNKIKWKLGCTVLSIEGSTVRYRDKEGAAESIEADLVLAAIGRRPNVEGWGAESLSLDRSAKGIVTDDRMRASAPGVWAAGDVTGRSLLAHSAYRMAEVAAADIDATLAGESGGRERMRWDAIPWAVYSIPDAAGVGMTEQEAKAKGFDTACAKINLRASGRFAAENGFQAQGAVKLVSDKASGRILGLHGVGSYASEAIWGGAALIEQEMRASELRELILPHPTVWELIRDAAWQLRDQ